MSKTYKGYELYKMIAEGKIKGGTKFKEDTDIIEFNGCNFIFADTRSAVAYRYDDISIAQMDFELIEDEMDIQQQETNWEGVGQAFGKMYIEFAKGFEEAVKQLDKKSGGK